MNDEELDDDWEDDDEEQDDDCLNCGYCDWCIERSERYAEESAAHGKYIFRDCVVCGRGLNDEDRELGTGMCLICHME